MGFNDLKGLKRKRNNQMRLVVAGQEPSNDEVSFSLQNLEFHFSRSFVKRKNLPLFVRNECLYSVVKVVTCLITFPTFVEVRNFTLLITAIEVRIFRIFSSSITAIGS